MLRAMNSRFQTLLLLAICFAAPLAGRAESWFHEARQIRKEADATAPRSKHFEILPVSTFTAEQVSAGALFQDKGDRVIVRQVQIHASVPVRHVDGKTVLKQRDREQHYTGEPAWSGRWRDPWKVGYFDYTVTATYKGNVYIASFKVGREGLLGEQPGKMIYGHDHEFLPDWPASFHHSLRRIRAVLARRFRRRRRGTDRRTD